ncbi:Pimeloyl-ACP methyl ester carboxylesterase [Fibrobacter sp. UWT3]|uniref:alpha/beta fold hydrolase n=1 Tax=Fibrobacter sp. UWT3 TaxID=1896225 RepID=UPI000BDC483E|nr:alpha/beta hydrolase [Fibrobacter sp. UWT3]SOE47074.1 Pimeloyl-ACP methyl ester carboxylesterase [Fibrobacter sp. UWT3]
MSEELVQCVRTDGFEMEYAKFGNGPRALVIIPGLAIKSVMKSAASLQVPYKMFTEGYTLYFFDRRKDVDPGYSLEEMARDQVLAMQALGLKDVALYGVSQGGMVAQHIAATHPELVWKLVLGCSTSKPEPQQLEVIGNWARLARAHDREGLVAAFIRDCFSSKFAERYSRALRAMYKDVSEAEMDRFAVFARECDNVDTGDMLASIKCPVLVLAASEDRVVLPIASDKIVEKLRAANVPYEYEIFEGYGHAAFDEIKEYKDRILQFLLKEIP